MHHPLLDRMLTVTTLAFLAAGGCDDHESNISGSTPDADTGTDPGMDTTVDTAVDTGADPTIDVVVDTAPDAVACTEAPACPVGPEDGVLGGACTGDGACDEVEAARCMRQMTETFDGETYVTYPGGTCQLYTGGTLACDPADHSGCPPGSRCIHVGPNYSGVDLYACFDACEPADASGEMFGWSCGCRVGYSCHINYGVCLTGCSNDRQCCETWTDLDGDYERDAGEVTLWPGCEMYCDGDDAVETEDCMATYECINPGLEGARFGDPCLHDSQCPADGICLNYTDPATGEESYPGGYCTRMGCQLAGRGCEADGGACMNVGSYEEPRGMCLQPCHTGFGPGDPEFQCRDVEGQEHACFPVNTYAWIGGPPPDGMDGYCMPGNFESGTGGLGDDCEDVGDCASPLGLGTCQTYFGDVPFCTVSCSETLAVAGGICGEADTGGVATGLCGWNMCFAGCDDPGAALGSGACERDEMACAPLSIFGASTYVAEGALKPPGFCMPACTGDAFCILIFGAGSVCDTGSGVCS